jgi:hypothetical protein
MVYQAELWRGAVDDLYSFKSPRHFLIKIKVQGAVSQKAGSFTNRWLRLHANLHPAGKSTNDYFERIK